MRDIDVKVLIDKYVAANTEWDNYKNIQPPIIPQALPAYTVDEYNLWFTKYKLYMEEQRRYIEKKEIILRNFKTIFDEVVYSLPAHVWLVTNDKKWAIAVQKSDWPMDPPKVLLKENPDIDKLTPLRIEHVPG